MKVRALLQNKVMLLLVDSGSSHSSVSSTFVQKVQLSPVSVPPEQVTQWPAPGQ